MSFLSHQCHSFRITVIPSVLLSFLPDYCHSFRIIVIPSKYCHSFRIIQRITNTNQLQRARKMTTRAEVAIYASNDKKMLGGFRASVGIYSFNFRRFERPCKSELFEITIYIVHMTFSFLAYFWPIQAQFFGPKLETSQSLLHTIAMKAMRIGTAFAFFLAMAVEALALAKGTAESCCTMSKLLNFVQK